MSKITITPPLSKEAQSIAANWSIEMPVGSDTHPELEARMAQVLQEEIDWEIMMSMFKEIGWTEVSVKRFSQPISNEREVKEWCKENLTGLYKGRGTNWLFENTDDATLFTLRWA